MKKAEREYLARVSDGGCVVCRLFHEVDSGPCEIHHVRDSIGMGQRADHFHVIGLCAAHHRAGGYGVAIHAGRKGFEERYVDELTLLEEYDGDNYC